MMEWISVKDELPLLRESVLLGGTNRLGNFHYGVGWLADEDGFFESYDDNYNAYYTTHWMLILPPKDGD